MCGVPFLPFIGGLACFFFAVFAAVDFFFFVCQYEDVGEFLFDGSDTAGVLAFNDIVDFPGEYQFLFIYDFAVLDHIDGDVMVDEGQDVQI